MVGLSLILANEKPVQGFDFLRANHVNSGNGAVTKPEPVMYKKFLKILAVAILVFVVVVIAQPNEFKVSRSITINAPASAIFAQVNDQQRWQNWSPWAKLDPDAKFTYEGPKAGVGAIAHWSGNSQVGEGTSTITESEVNKRILFKLDFVKPMKGTNSAEFTFKPSGKATEVTWTMSGENDFIGKAIGLIMNCKKMVGEQFEQGLTNLKNLVEKK
jgi:hypothetical protein